mgnify:CR=1 FL=1
MEWRQKRDPYLELLWTGFFFPLMCVFIEFDFEVSDVGLGNMGGRLITSLDRYLSSFENRNRDAGKIKG